jgi:hypothetical protein
MAKRYIARRTTTTREGTSREYEQLRRELSSYLQEEITRMFNLALGDFERNMAQSLTGMAATTLNVVDSGQANIAGTGGVGGAFSSLLARYVRTRTRRETSQSGAVETSRSTSENQFYRESASQQATSASETAQGGTRNL